MINYYTPSCSIMHSFYKDCHIDRKNINDINIDDVIEKSKKLNGLYNSSDFKPTKLQRYIKLMERIHCNYRLGVPTKSEFSTTSIIEKLVLFALSIDPEFEAFIIYSSENTINEIKKQMIYKFGIYDKNLIKIEKIFIKNFLDKEKQNSINEEIDKRTFK